MPLAKPLPRPSNNAFRFGLAGSTVKTLHPTENLPAGGKRGGKSYFSPDDNCVGNITEMFGTARASVDVCVFTITDNRIVDAMERAHRRNVQVRVISDDKAMDAGSDIDRLERMGIPCASIAPSITCTISLPSS